MELVNGGYGGVRKFLIDTACVFGCAFSCDIVTRNPFRILVEKINEK